MNYFFVHASRGKLEFLPCVEQTIFLVATLTLQTAAQVLQKTTPRAGVLGTTWKSKDATQRTASERRQ